jgi:hypothetical protein
MGVACGRVGRLVSHCIRKPRHAHRAAKVRCRGWRMGQDAKCRAWNDQQGEYAGIHIPASANCTSLSHGHIGPPTCIYISTKSVFQYQHIQPANLPTNLVFSQRVYPTCCLHYPRVRLNLVTGSGTY